MGFLVNPVQVPFNSLSSMLVNSSPAASVASLHGPVLAQFVSVAMISMSSLRSRVGNNRPWKAVSVLLPCVALDHLQTCFGVAFDKWDDPMCGNISDKGLDVSCKREYETKRVSLC